MRREDSKSNFVGKQTYANYKINYSSSRRREDINHDIIQESDDQLEKERSSMNKDSWLKGRIENL
jgi:hypothetical protein